MNETIGKKIVEILGSIVDIALDENGTEVLPYAVYSMEVAPSYTKGGVYKYSGTMTLVVYADSGAAADNLASLCRESIDASMQGARYRTRLNNVTSETVDGKSAVIMEYSVAQHKMGDEITNN